MICILQQVDQLCLLFRDVRDELVAPALYKVDQFDGIQLCWVDLLSDIVLVEIVIGGRYVDARLFVLKQTSMGELKAT